MEMCPLAPKKQAVVLLSGGLDSATVAAIASSEGFAVNALSFSYGQRHSFELQAAQRVASSLNVDQHRVANIDLRAFGGSAAETALPQTTRTATNRHRKESEHVIVRPSFLAS